MAFAVFVCGFILICVLARVPQIQSYVSEQVSAALSSKFGTRVSIRRIEPGLLNTLILEDVTIKDQQSRDLLRSGRIAVKLKLRSVLSPPLVIRTVELYHADINLIKQDKGSPYNFQFIIDSLQSGKKQGGETQLKLKSIILNSCRVSHNILTAPHKRTFDFNHAYFRNIYASAGLRIAGNDRISFKLRDLSLRERSGLAIDHAFLYGAVDNRGVTIPKFRLSLPESEISANDIRIYHTPKGAPQLDARILPSTISIADIRPLVSFRLPDEQFLFRADIRSRGGTIRAKNIRVTTKDNGLSLSAEASYRNKDAFTARIDRLRISGQALSAGLDYLPASAKQSLALQNLNYLDYSGFIRSSGRIESKGKIDTNLGEIAYDVCKETSDNLIAALEVRHFLLSRLLNTKLPIGEMDCRLNFSGIPKDHFFSEINIERLTYNGNVVSPVTASVKRSGADWHIDMNSDVENARAKVTLSATNPLTDNGEYKLSAIVRNLNIDKLGLSDRLKGRGLSGAIDVAAYGKLSSPHTLTIRSHDARIYSSDTTTVIGSVAADYKRAADGTKVINVTGDAGDVNLKGKYNLATIPTRILDILNKRAVYRPQSDNVFSFRMRITDAKLLNLLLSDNYMLRGMTEANGFMDSKRGEAQVTLTSPYFARGNFKFDNVRLFARTNSSDTQFRFHAVREVKGDRVNIEAMADDVGKGLNVSFLWNNGKGRPNSEISQTVTFQPSTGEDIVSVIHPSSFFAGDSLCHITSGTLRYKNRKVSVDNLNISSGDNSLSLSGGISSSPDDSLSVTLHGIRLQSVLDFVAFDDVQFDGDLTGKVYVGAVTGEPWLKASINSDDFIFNHAHMGHLDLSAYWRNETKHIDIFASILDTQGSSTNISGYVSPAHNDIDLHFLSMGTNILFINDFFPDGLEFKQGKVAGDLRLFGNLRAMNLEGAECVHDGRISVDPLGTEYTVDNDTVRFSHNLISMPRLHLKDKYGGEGLLSGAVMHRALHDFSYDINITSPRFLAYDVPRDEADDASFWGKAFVDGRIHVFGSPGRFATHADVTALGGTSFVYNAESRMYVGAPEFLQYRARREAAATDTARGSTPAITQATDSLQKSIRGDMELNFNIDISPEAEFQVITDEKSGNGATVHGTGRVNAYWSNKDNFQMFGAYNISSGYYRMKIQDLIERNFAIQQGGRITFSGQPLDGILSLSAVYSLPSVSLSGLTAGSNMRDASQRVDCIMNITGTAATPTVSFDIDMPTASSTQRQMVRSIIATPEDMNLQAMYLLSVGQFYTYDYTPDVRYQSSGRSSVAMNSFLSGTLSQNFGKFLHEMGLNNEKWSFGTSVATGQEGWNDMDVEGLFSAKLLGGRLFIDGNLGYRDRAAYTSNLVGDFTARYLLNPAGTIQLKAYSESNDRYFTRHSLTTQGGGILFKRDFNNLKQLFKRKPRQKKTAKRTPAKR